MKQFLVLLTSLSFASCTTTSSVKNEKVSENHEIIQLTDRKPADLTIFSITACGEIHRNERGRAYISIPDSKKRQTNTPSLLKIPDGPMTFGFSPAQPTPQKVAEVNEKLRMLIQPVGERDGVYFCFTGKLHVDKKDNLQWIDVTEYPTSRSNRALVYVEVACFTGEMLAGTPNGEVPISTLKIGDQVWSYNFTSKQMEVDLVDEVYTYENKSIDRVFLSDGTIIEATPEHPFYVYESEQFLSIGQLDGNTNLVKKTEDSFAMATITKRIRSANRTKVYNIRVKKNHNYFINGFLVHNKPS